MRKEKAFVMKKSALLAFVLSIAMLSCLPVSAAATYSFGNGEMFKEADWGKDGFTFQFAQTYNQAGDYDVSQFQDCEWGNSSAYAMYVSGRRMWCPTVRAADTGKFKNDTMWWQVSNENGSLMPSNGLLAILRWTAPQDGKYTVNTTLLAGVSQAYEDHQTEYGPFEMNEDMDGVTCSIYHDSEKLYSKNSGQVFYTDSKMDVPVLTVEMHQGESLYFIADQNAQSDYDDSQWQVEIVRTADLPTTAPAAPVTDAPPTTTRQDTTSGDETKTDSPDTTQGSEDETTTELTTSSTLESGGTTRATATSSTREAGAATDITAGGDPSDPGLSPAALAGIVAAVAVVLAAAGVGVYFLLKKKKAAGDPLNPEDPGEHAGNPGDDGENPADTAANPEDHGEEM